jgi:hypothetical protein
LRPAEQHDPRRDPRGAELASSASSQLNISVTEPHGFPHAQAKKAAPAVAAVAHRREFLTGWTGM